LFRIQAATSGRQFVSIIDPASQPAHIAFISDLITMTWQLASSSPLFPGKAEKIRPVPTPQPPFHYAGIS
jgi:hypothetical protein